MIFPKTIYQPTFTRNIDKINPQLQKLIDSVDTSLIKTQKLKDSFEQIGHNNKPVVAVIDDFYAIKWDVNGDNIDDLSHGELASLYAADAANILPIDANIEHPDYTKIIKSIMESVNEGANIKAINLSIDIGISNQEFNDYLLRAVEDLPGETFKDKIVAYAESCMEKVTELSRLSCITPQGEELQHIEFQHRMAMLYPAFKVLKDLPEIDIPVYISAGNKVDAQNLLTHFFKDPIIVSSEQPENVYSKVYNRLEQASFYVTELFKADTLLGYDINEDGKLDVRSEEVSQELPILKSFVGKDANTLKVDQSLVGDLKKESSKYVIDNDKILGLLKTGLGKLFSINQLEDLFNESLEAFRGYGEYVFQIAGTDDIYFAFHNILKVDENNKLYCDPYNKGIKNAIHFINGTSFAAPTAIDKDIKAGKISLEA